MMILIAVTLGTMAMAQSTASETNASDKKTSMQKTEVRKLKKVDATVIERKESSAADVPAESSSSVKSGDESRNQEVQKAKNVKSHGTEADSKKKSEKAKGTRSESSKK